MRPDLDVLKLYGLFRHAGIFQHAAIYPRYVTQAAYFARAPPTGHADAVALLQLIAMSHFVWVSDHGLSCSGDVTAVFFCVPAVTVFCDVPAVFCVNKDTCTISLPPPCTKMRPFVEICGRTN